MQTVFAVKSHPRALAAFQIQYSPFKKTRVDPRLRE